MEKLNIYYAQNGERRGPYTLEEIIQLNLPSNTLVYYTGLGQWTPISSAPATATYYTIPQAQPEPQHTAPEIPNPPIQHNPVYTQPNPTYTQPNPSYTPPTPNYSQPAPQPNYTSQSYQAPGYDTSDYNNSGYEYTEYDRPKTYMAWAIIVTILCCWPLGIPAIVYASKVDRLWNEGRYEEAFSASKKAKNFTIWSAVSSIIFFFLYILFYVFIFAAAASGY